MGKRGLEMAFLAVGCEGLALYIFNLILFVGTIDSSLRIVRFSEVWAVRFELLEL